MKRWHMIVVCVGSSVASAVLTDMRVLPATAAVLGVVGGVSAIAFLLEAVL